MFQNNRRKSFILGIDGVSYSFLRDRFGKGEMPNFSRLCGVNLLKRIDSVYPPVSSAAWTTFATGQDPAGHNIFGFVDRIPNPFRMKIFTARDRKAKTIWQELSEQGKK